MKNQTKKEQPNQDLYGIMTQEPSNSTRVPIQLTYGNHMKRLKMLKKEDLTHLISNLQRRSTLKKAKSRALRVEGKSSLTRHSISDSIPMKPALKIDK